MVAVLVLLAAALLSGTSASEEAMQIANGLFPKQEIESCASITDPSVCCYSFEPRSASGLGDSPAGGDACVWAKRGPDAKFTTGNKCEASSKLIPYGENFVLAINDIDDGTTGGCWGRVFALNRGPGLFDSSDIPRSGGFPFAQDNEHAYQVLGTHDAATGEFGPNDQWAPLPPGYPIAIPLPWMAAGGFFSRRTQTIHMVDQLNCGVRHLDFRPLDLKGSIAFHHAYYPIMKDFREAVGEIKEWSNDHPTELVVLWMNNCGTADENDRRWQCDQFTEVDGISRDGNACDGPTREGSDWCYSQLLTAWQEGIPALGGASFPPSWVENKNAYANNGLTSNWTLADYKTFAAGNHGTLLKPNGEITNLVAEAKGGVLILQGQSVQGGDTDPPQGFKIQGGGELNDPQVLLDAVKSVKGNSNDDPAGSAWKQTQAFYQQAPTYVPSYTDFGAEQVALGNKKHLGLVRLARTSGFNKDLLEDVRNDPSNYRIAVSINDVCDWGIDIAKALGGAVITADDQNQSVLTRYPTP